MGYVHMFFVVAAIFIFMAVQTLSKDKTEKLNRIFFTISMLFFLWSIVNGILYLITDVDIAVDVRRYAVFAWGIIYSLILHFVLIMTGNDRKMNQSLMHFLLYFPALINIYLYFFQPLNSTELMYTDPGWIIGAYFTRGFIWDNYFYIYYVSFMIITLIVLYLWLRKDHSTRVVLQSKLIFYTFVIAFLTGTLFEIVLPINGISIFYGVTVVIALIPIGGIWYSMKKYGLMSFKPENLALEVLQLMDEGLIICDIKGDIKKINDGAIKLLDYKRNVSNNISEFLHQIDITSNHTSIEEELLIDENKFISILISVLPLFDSVNEQYGALIIFQDISKLKKIQTELIETNSNLEKLVEERTMNLVDANEELLLEIQARKTANALSEHMAYHDFLTNLPNKRSFLKTLENEAKDNNTLAVLFLDLDAFKSVNDVLGHLKGDELLKKIAKRLQLLERYVEKIARYGGDEFIIIIKDFSNEAELKDVINRVLQVFEIPFEVNDQVIHMTCSIGVSLFPEHSRDITELLRYADIAMYEAKLLGRNRYEIFSDHMKRNLKEEFNISSDLHNAISEKEFVLHYQPQIDAKNNIIVGMEALIRWQHPTYGLLYPKSFIKLSEKNGLIIDIGEFVIIEALEQHKRWSNNHRIDFPISVNVSIAQLVSDRFDQFIDKVSAHYGDLSNLEFEVTETIFSNKWEKVTRTLEKLQGYGSSIAIDDFGVEYSSLKYIRHMQLSKIKIDKLFIDGVYFNKKNQALVNTIIALAQNLDMKIVAEGVESYKQMEYLLSHDCSVIQGYYYSKPVDEAGIEQLLIEYKNVIVI